MIPGFISRTGTYYLNLDLLAKFSTAVYIGTRSYWLVAKFRSIRRNRNRPVDTIL
eukprot:SAG31_NODE_60_length_29419_cov_39.876398_14_plen_55_part_00